MPQISVVIPTFNCAEYLATAIDSVLAQTFRDLEVIVVDDGSTDETRSVVGAYGDRILYIRTENRGAASARNQGLQACSGEYLAFLDADDWWEPTKLAEQMSALADDGDAGLVYCDMHVHYDDGTTLDSFLSNKSYACSGYVFDQLMQSQFIFPSTVLLKMSCVREVGTFDESMQSLEDCDFLLRFCYRWKVAMVPKPLVHRRQREGSLTSNEAFRTRYLITFHEKALQLPSLSGSRIRHFEQRLSRVHFNRASYCFQERQIEECRSNLVASLRYNWKNLRALRFLVASYFPPILIRQFGALRRAQS
jgi:glycosyltransferase involved in cell wall biosynthesis